MKVVMTGGHHSSALPIIERIREDSPNNEVLWFGHKHSLKNDTNVTLEYIDITRMGIKFIELKSGKVYRNLNINSLLLIVNAIGTSFNVLKEYKPDVILSFGGYLAVPVVIAGWLLGVKIITHEQTLIAGFANRFISYFADRVLISWTSSSQYFPSFKTFFTGIPVRKNILAPAGTNFNFNNGLPTILVVGGKSGSHMLNEVILSCISKLLGSYNLIHQCGDYSEFNDYSKLNATYLGLTKHKGIYSLHRFLNDEEIGDAYRQADLVVCRAGAHTTLELLILKKKAILIPIPWVSHNEQYLNALMVSQSGLGIILKESEVSPDVLVSTISIGINESYKLKEGFMSEYPLDADSRILNQIKLVLEGETKD